MMFSKDCAAFVAASVLVICVLFVVAFSGCVPTTNQDAGKSVSPKETTPTQPAEKPAEKPANPQAVLVEPEAKVGSDASATVDAPKVSSFAPAADLASQADWYIKDLESAVADEEEYKDSVDKIAKESNTLVIVALALGLHDEENKYKASAGAVMKAAQDLAATKDLASAKKGVAALKDAASGKGNAVGELKWVKVAALPELMKQVPVVHTKLKLMVKGASFKKKAKDTKGYTAVIAAVAQGSMADASATKSDDQVKQWQAFCAAMRDSAAEVNAAIRKADQPAATKGMEKLNKSCDDCHVVFHPEANALMGK